MPERTTEQWAADDANIQGLPIDALTRAPLIHEIGTFLSARDLAGVLGACHGLRNSMPAAIRTLDGFNKGKTDIDTVIELVQRFHLSTCIDLAGCTELTDAAIVAVADKCPNLALLDVTRCYKLTNTAVVAIANKYTNLVSLNAAGCDNLTNTAIVTVADKCTNLAKLNVGRCSELTAAAIVAVADK